MLYGNVSHFTHSSLRGRPISSSSRDKSHRHCLSTTFVIAGPTRNPCFAWHWIPGRARDDKLLARDDKLLARDDKLLARDDKLLARDDKLGTAPMLKASEIEALAKGRSLWSDARRRFMRNKAALISLGLLSFIALACIAGPWLLPHAFDSADWDAMSIPPGWKNAHFWGTDDAGRDLLVRCLIGGRVSLTVGLLATLASVSIGIVWGATAGFIGGKVDTLMMRVVDMMYAIPYLLIAILLVTILGREFYLVVLTITAFSWMDMARVVRGQTLSLRSMEYVEAARAMGVSSTRIIFRHIVPNLLGVVVIYTTVTVPGVILTESVLSFLGLGIQEPMTSWGVLIQDGAKAMEVTPWILLFPAGLLSVTLYCFNFIGDGLRDALDPKER